MERMISFTVRQSARPSPQSPLTGAGKGLAENSQMARPQHLGIPIEVTLGDPAKDCQHFGICRIDFFTTSSLARLSCGCQLKAFIRQYGQEGVELLFFEKDIPEAVAKRHFPDGFFQVKTAYLLREAVATAIGLEQFVFMPGIYPVIADSEHPGFWRITFRSGQ